MHFFRLLPYLLAFLFLALPSCGGGETSVEERMDALRDKDFEVADYWQDFDGIAAGIRSLIKAESGVDLRDVDIRLADRDEMADAFVSNVSPQLDLLGEEMVDHVILAQQIKIALLGIYDISEKEILICQENFPFLAEFVAMPDLDSLDAMKAVLIHEASHAVADLNWDLAASMKDLEDANHLAGLSAVIEGYAQYLARKICTQEGLVEGFETFTAAVGATPETDNEMEKLVLEAATANVSFQYYDGEDFVRAIVEAKGEEAIAGLFADPPLDHAYVSHPDWYLDPSIAERGSMDLESFLDLFENEFAGSASGNQVEMNSPTFRAAMSPLPAEDIDAIEELVLANRINAIVEGGGAQMQAMVLYECRSSVDAATMAGYSERLLRARDEAFKEGSTRITEALYEDFEAGPWEGMRVDKTMKMGRQEIVATTFILQYSNLSSELSFIGHDVDVDEIREYYADLTEAAFPEKK
ncbi:MAG: hypothetical protein ACPG31_08055 [Planctomycetota bacterium]